MPRQSLLKVLFVLCSLSTAVACAAHSTKNERQADSSLAAFTVPKFSPESGDPSWSRLDVAMQRLDGNKAAVRRSFNSGDFTTGSVKDLTIEIPQGLYTIELLFKDEGGKDVYKECDRVAFLQYKVLTREFQPAIPVCKVEAAAPAAPVAAAPVVAEPVAVTPAGSVEITPNSAVTIHPVAGTES